MRSSCLILASLFAVLGASFAPTAGAEAARGDFSPTPPEAIISANATSTVDIVVEHPGSEEGMLEHAAGTPDVSVLVEQATMETVGETVWMRTPLRITPNSGFVGQAVIELDFGAYGARQLKVWVVGAPRINRVAGSAPGGAVTVMAHTDVSFDVGEVMAGSTIDYGDGHRDPLQRCAAGPTAVAQSCVSVHRYATAGSYVATVTNQFTHGAVDSKVMVSVLPPPATTLTTEITSMLSAITASGPATHPRGTKPGTRFIGIHPVTGETIVYVVPRSSAPRSRRKGRTTLLVSVDPLTGEAHVSITAGPGTGIPYIGDSVTVEPEPIRQFLEKSTTDPNDVLDSLKQLQTQALPAGWTAGANQHTPLDLKRQEQIKLIELERRRNQDEMKRKAEELQRQNAELQKKLLDEAQKLKSAGLLDAQKLATSRTAQNAAAQAKFMAMQGERNAPSTPDATMGPTVTFEPYGKPATDIIALTGIMPARDAQQGLSLSAPGSLLSANAASDSSAAQRDAVTLLAVASEIYMIFGLPCDKASNRTAVGRCATRTAPGRPIKIDRSLRPMMMWRPLRGSARDWRLVHSAPATDGSVGVHPATGTIRARFGLYSSPTNLDVLSGVEFSIAESTSERVQRLGHAIVTGWPRRPLLRTGVVVSCPIRAVRGCVFRVNARSTYRRIPGNIAGSVVRLQAGQVRQLNAPLTLRGRWRNAARVVPAKLTVRSTVRYAKRSTTRIRSSSIQIRYPARTSR